MQNRQINLLFSVDNDWRGARDDCSLKRCWSIFGSVSNLGKVTMRLSLAALTLRPNLNQECDV